jgi:hypothetical protein
MAVKGIDFAWQKPSPAEVKALGCSFVAGYLSNDPSKNLTRSEVDGYLADGIAVVTVWETTAGRATAGYTAGVDDARQAEAQRIALRLPSDHVIYFAVDEDTSWASVQAYFDGAASVIGKRRVGDYGGFDIVEGAYAHGINFGWQTIAWSNGRWSAHADIRQEGGTLLGGSADLDYAEVADFGQTPHPGSIPAPPNQTPPPAPKPVRSVLEDDMAQIPALLPDKSNAETMLTFPRGSAKTVAFFCDNTRSGGPNDPGAKLRVTIFATGQPDDLYDGDRAVVVTNHDNEQVVLNFKVPETTHSVSVVRLDEGRYPVGVEVS